MNGKGNSSSLSFRRILFGSKGPRKSYRFRILRIVDLTVWPVRIQIDASHLTMMILRQFHPSKIIIGQIAFGMDQDGTLLQQLYRRVENRHFHVGILRRNGIFPTTLWSVEPRSVQRIPVPRQLCAFCILYSFSNGIGVIGEQQHVAGCILVVLVVEVRLHVFPYFVIFPTVRAVQNNIGPTHMDRGMTRRRQGYGFRPRHRLLPQPRLSSCHVLQHPTRLEGGISLPGCLPVTCL